MTLHKICFIRCPESSTTVLLLINSARESEVSTFIIGGKTCLTIIWYILLNRWLGTVITTNSNIIEPLLKLSLVNMPSVYIFLTNLPTILCSDFLGVPCGPAHYDSWVCTGNKRRFFGAELSLKNAPNIPLYWCKLQFLLCQHTGDTLKFLLNDLNTICLYTESLSKEFLNIWLSKTL